MGLFNFIFKKGSQKNSSQQMHVPPRTSTISMDTTTKFYSSFISDFENLVQTVCRAMPSAENTIIITVSTGKGQDCRVNCNLHADYPVPQNILFGTGITASDDRRVISASLFRAQTDYNEGPTQILDRISRIMHSEYTTVTKTESIPLGEGYLITYCSTFNYSPQ